MTNETAIRRVETGSPNLDAILGGGLPEGSLTVFAGPPGAGKTILAQQLCFHNASPGTRVVYFNTLSEPSAKTLRYLAAFRYFDPAKLRDCVEFVDLGDVLRSGHLEAVAALFAAHLERVRPAIVVVDSFKVVDDLARSAGELRRFSYEIAVQLMVWQCTTLLLGEYAPSDYETTPLFSITDGLITFAQREIAGEVQRVLQVVKMRGTAQDRSEHAFMISPDGVEVFAPRALLRRSPEAAPGAETPRCQTGISKLDELLGSGIPRGSSVLVAGAAGTGKTVLSLEFVYRGAQRFDERGILFSFEETAERLRAAGRGLGWDLDREIARGMLEIVFIPQPEIAIEQHLMLIRDRVAAGAARVAIDSVSVFLHRLRDPQEVREKVFQLATIVQNAGAVGFFAMDVPYGSDQLSRFGVEETVVDGVILLRLIEEALERQRYLEVYKMRNTAHLKGLHNMVIGAGGITVYPRYNAEALPPPPPVDTSRRLSWGVPGLDALLGGGLLERSITLVAGSAGIGKSTLAVQFALEGARRGEPVVFVTLEESPEQVIESAATLGLPLREAVAAGHVDVVYLSQQHVRTAQFLAILSDRVRALGARRAVIDGTGHLQSDRFAPDQLRQILYVLATRLKSLSATSLFTLESPSLFATDFVTDRCLSPIADNLLMLRYAETAGRIERTLAVVKTRGSAHAEGTFRFALGAGGVRILAPPGGEAPR